MMMLLMAVCIPRLAYAFFIIAILKVGLREKRAQARDVIAPVPSS
jgi:hypothetical protein